MRQIFSNPMQRLCDGLLYEIRHDARIPAEMGGGMPDSQRLLRMAVAFICNELMRPRSTLGSWIVENTDFGQRGKSRFTNYWGVLLDDERWEKVNLDPRLDANILGWTLETLLDVEADIREDGL